MKYKSDLLFILSLLLLSLPVCMARAENSPDVASGPYFFISGDSESTEAFPLKETSAEVQISGVIAKVKVKQVYKNQGKVAIEAVYVFPGSTRAAVNALSMTIGERHIEAKIEKKEQARNMYERAKSQGQTATLLEQQRPNVFQMNVANILPNDEVTVVLEYNELLVPTDGTYQFVYPTVVGPRYAGGQGQVNNSDNRWVSNPYLSEGQAAPYSFDLHVNLAGGLPLQDVRSPSHKVQINYSDRSLANISLDSSERAGGDRDFILEYRLADKKIVSGVLLDKGSSENFFLAVVEPPERVSQANVVPREYIFILDVSGSMNGFPIGVSKALIKDLTSGLRETDKFNILLFAGSSELFAPQSVNATSENVNSGLQMIERQRGSGGTELLPALKRAFDLPQEESYSRSIVVLTDGFVSVENETFDLIQRRLGQANFFSFGIGSSVNRLLIEGMAHVGRGEPFIVTNEAEARIQSGKFHKYVISPVLTNLSVKFSGLDVYDVEPQVIPDLFASRPVLVYGKWKGEPTGTLEIKGRSASGEYSNIVNITEYSNQLSNPALAYLWACKRIQLLSDYIGVQSTQERIEEVVGLGIKYNLLTAYTSFIAVDNIKRNLSTQAVTVQQPLPLPQGVSNNAVGSNNRLAPNSSPVTFGAPSVSSAGDNTFRSSGDAVTTFSEASYNDTLQRNALGNAFCLINGAFGVLVMVLSALIGITCLYLKRLKTGAFFMSIAVLSFILRAFINSFFGSSGPY